MPHVMTTCIPKAHKGSRDALCYNTLRDATLRILCAWKRCLIHFHNASSHSHKSRSFYTLFLSIMHQVCVPASVPSRHLGSTLSVLPEEDDHTLMLIIMVLTHHIRNTLCSLVALASIAYAPATDHQSAWLLKFCFSTLPILSADMLISIFLSFHYRPSFHWMRLHRWITCDPLIKDS